MFQPNQQIGHYTLIRRLGQGGFGEVWLADKPNDLLHPQVALKLPLDPAPDIAAIQEEAKTWLHAGRHANVVPVIAAEIVDKQVVIASEYVSGGSLVGWLQHGGRAPSIEAAVEMTTGILSGLEHLHNLKPQPIIHRDLKPDNVLLQNGVPRLTDFGISRVMKATAHTQHSAGTPHYMPPEAFDGKFSPRSDIWAVGVMLYQMLTGRLPFPQTELTPLFGAIVKGSPDPLPADIPNLLRNVIAKALAKDPAKRFASAAEMRDVLNGKQRLTPSINPDLTPPVKTTSPPRPLPQTVFDLPLPPPPKPRKMKVVSRRTRLLNRRNFLFVGLGCVAYGSIYLWGNRDTSQMTLGGDKSAIFSVAWSPDSNYIVTGNGEPNSVMKNRDDTAKVWNAATGNLMQTLSGHSSTVVAVAWSPNGKAIVTGSDDGTAKIWNTANRSTVQTLGGRHSSFFNAVAWSPDSRYIVTGNGDNMLGADDDDNTAKIWNATTGNLMQTLSGHHRTVRSVAWSHNGKYIVTGSWDSTAKIWNAATGSLVRTLSGHNDSVFSVSWSPDSNYIVTASKDKTAKIWNAANGSLVRTLNGHRSVVTSVAWSPDDKYIVTGSGDKTAKIWQVSP